MVEQGEQRWQVAAGGEETSVLYQPAESAGQNMVYVMAHGAGGNMDHRHMGRFAHVFRSLGLGVVRFNFFYRAHGRKYPDRMPQLIECYTAVVESVRQRLSPQRLLIGGQSMGGRTASMMAAEGFACDGLILLAYPLHPPGKPESLRAAHLPQIRVPVVCFNGTRDDFCRRELMEPIVAGLPDTWTMHWIEAADHGFRVPRKSGRSDTEVTTEVAGAVRAWLLQIRLD